jgi:hypothetical protein
MFKPIAPFSLIVVAGLLAGCASVPTASDEVDRQAKTFAVAPGKSNIYLFRNESMGAAVKMDVALDGRPVGQTAAKTYMLFEVEPGKHTLVSKAENESILEVNAAAGANQFVWQEVKMGLLFARSSLQLVDDAVGKAGVAECKLVSTSGGPATTARVAPATAVRPSPGARVKAVPSYDANAAASAAMATLYVLQGDTGHFGKLTITVDGRATASVKANSYIALQLEPGSHTIGSAAASVARLSITVTAGKTSYIGQSVDADGKPDLRELSESDARALMTRYLPM